MKPASRRSNEIHVLFQLRGGDASNETLSTSEPKGPLARYALETVPINEIADSSPEGRSRRCVWYYDLLLRTLHFLLSTGELSSARETNSEFSVLFSLSALNLVESASGSASWQAVARARRRAGRRKRRDRERDMYSCCRPKRFLVAFDESETAFGKELTACIWTPLN